MDAVPQNQIKPLLPHTIHIKSLFTFNCYLVKRPKHTTTFKFSRQGDLIGDEKENRIKSELKLQKTLHLLKSVKKVDLSRLQVKGINLNQNRFQSCFKHSVSKASTLYWTRYQLYNQLGANFAEKPLKHLSKLHNLVYYMTSEGLPGWIESYKGPCTKDPLRYLRYCPKIESLNLGSRDGSSQMFSGLHTYSTLLKRLALKLPNKEEERGFAFRLENFLKLESLYFKFDGNLNEDYWAWNLEGLSYLENLQEVNLEFNIDFFPEVHPMLRKMAERKTMKKVRFIFPDSVLADAPIDREIMKAFQGFDQLTHFELSILIPDDNVLKTLSESLENMKHLQDLRLTISKPLGFGSFGNLKALCQKIQNLQSLRHLHLSFLPIRAETEIPNFILERKPMKKLETLSLAYSQVNPTQSLIDLAAALKDSSTSLRNLKVFFGSCSPDQKGQRLILENLSSLSHLQVLEMLGLEVEDDNFLTQIGQAISKLKYLREFALGDVREGVTASVYEDALEAILSKRGLRKFKCQTCDSLIESCGLTISLFGESTTCRVNMRRIERKNPFIEIIQISHHVLRMDLLKEIAYWA